MKSGYKKPTPIKVTTTGDSRVLSSNNAIVRHRADKPSQRKGTTNPNTNPTAPTIANLPSESPNIPPSSAGTGVSTSSPDVSAPSQREIVGSPEPQQVSFSSGGRGDKGDSADRFVALSTGDRYATMGEALNADWNYYKPVAGLALWQSGAAEAVFQKATSLVNNVISKFAPKNTGKTINWAQETIQRTGMPAVTKKAGKVVPAINSKTLFGLNKNFVKAGFSLVTAAYLIKEGVSAKSFSEFELSEASQVLGFSRTKAVEAGDMDSVAELDAMMNDILNQSKWQEFASYVPFVGSMVGTRQHLEAAELTNEVYKRLDSFVASGDNSVVDWEKARQEQIATEQAITDYRIEQNAIAQKNKRLAELKQMEKVAAYWKKYQEDLDKMEMEQLQRTADFWDEYNKKKAEYEAHKANSFSNLGFGLI